MRRYRSCYTSSTWLGMFIKYTSGNLTGALDGLFVCRIQDLS